MYDLLKIHKILELEMTVEKLIDHVISRLEPQILDYVEVRHTQTTSNLLQIIDKYEEWFLNRKIRDSSWESRDIKPSKNNRFPNRNRFENQGVADNRRFDGRRRGGQSDHRFHNQENPPDSEHRTIRISSLRMTPVDLPYVPILLNETFITALWDTRAEKSFITEEVDRKYRIDRVKRRKIE
ncbi:uncharacterized protein TNCV_372381 [Trichonephila clavipes]|nr:uncharacterized protein TNCV_372381 [Trichonephila clavipes]